MPYLFYSLYTKISSQLERGLMSRREKTTQVIQDTIGKWLRVRETGASLVAQLVKNPLAMQGTWVRSLGWEDPLEKGKATHSSILAWTIPWTVHGIAKSRTQLSNFHFQRRLSRGVFLSQVVVSFLLGGLVCNRQLRRCTQGQYPQHTENFIFMPGGQVVRYHSMRDGRHGRREPDVVSTVRAQDFAGRKFGLSGCICGLNP